MQIVVKRVRSRESLLSGKIFFEKVYRTAGIEIAAIFHAKGFLKGYIATIKGLLKEISDYSEKFTGQPVLEKKNILSESRGLTFKNTTKSGFSE